MKQMKLVTLAAVAMLLTAALSACGPTAKASASAQDPGPQQGALCEVSNWRKDAVAKVCKIGQKVVYLPESWGNDQLPIIFAAVNCDLRYQVALTKGAVTCIYAPLSNDSQAAAAGSQQAPQAAN